MATLANKIKAYLGMEVNFLTEIKLQDDMISRVSNPYIKEWNATDKPQPTEEQLNALESEAGELEIANQVMSNRKAEYPSVQDLVVALYDTEDKIAIDIKRAEIKLKYPKPGA